MESPELQHKIKANNIWLRHGCDLQTHQDDTTHTRRRAIHVLSSQKTPEGTSLPQAFGGVCNLESAELKNKVTQNAFALNMDPHTDAPRRYKPHKKTYHAYTQLTKDSRRYGRLVGSATWRAPRAYSAWQKTVTHHHCFGAWDQV